MTGNGSSTGYSGLENRRISAANGVSYTIATPAAPAPRTVCR